MFFTSTQNLLTFLKRVWWLSFLLILTPVNVAMDQHRGAVISTVASQYEGSGFSSFSVQC